MATGSDHHRHGSSIPSNRIVPQTDENAASSDPAVDIVQPMSQESGQEVDRLPDAKPESLGVQMYRFLEEPESGSGAKFLSCFILLTIMVSVTFLIAETIPDVKTGKDSEQIILWVEIFSTAIFSVEYVARFLVCGAGGQSKLQFVKTPTNVLDILAILPFYLELMLSQGDTSVLRVLRSVRLLRIFRIFKLGKYSSGLHIMVESLRKSAEPLMILGFFLGIGVVLFSSLLFYVEKTSCPDIPALIADGGFERYRADCDSEGSGWTKPFRTGQLCCNEFGSADDFQSIPATFWWSFATMSTVGYGDVYPRTSAGRLIGSLSMLCGILLISLPVAIVGSKFQEVYEEFEIRAEEEKERTKRSREHERLERGDSRNASSAQEPDSPKAGGDSPSWRSRLGLQKSASVKSQGEGSDPGSPQKDPLKEEGSQVEITPVSALKTALKPSAPKMMSKKQRSYTTSFESPKGSMDQVPAIREQLRRLQNDSGLSEIAQEQIKVILSIFEEVEELTDSAETLRLKDRDLQLTINQEVAALSTVYKGSMSTGST